MIKLRSAALVVLTVSGVAVPTAAMADDYATTNTTVVMTSHVLADVVSAPARSDSPVAVLGTSVTQPSSGSLPFTGGDVAGLVAVGVVLLGAGTILVRRNRSASANR